MLRMHTAAFLAALALPVLAAAPAVAATDQPSGPCQDGGVTVVVDATALGGEVLIGCATQDPATGTEALEQAGFVETRDASGMICAIDSLPDPCPTEFTGEYWSYWYADGDWQSYMEGSDTSTPQDGAVEGWAWGDGSTPPGADLTTLPGTEPSEPAEPEGAEEDSSEDETVSEDATSEEATAESAQANGVNSAWWWVAGGVGLGAVVIGIVVFSRRSHT